MGRSSIRAPPCLSHTPAPGRNALRGRPSRRGEAEAEVPGVEEEVAVAVATTATVATTRGTTTTNYYIPNIYASALRNAHLPLILLI